MKYKRQRYLLFYYILEKEKIEFNEKILINLIWRSISRYFGIKETSNTGLWIVELNPMEHWGILRFVHTSKENVISSLGMIRFLKDSRFSIYPVKTSGTIKKIKKFLNEIQNEKKLNSF